MPAECMCCRLAPTCKKRSGSGAASFPLPPHFDGVVRGVGVPGGFILFNLHLIGRRGGVISKPHHPSTIQGCHSAAAPPQLHLQPPPRLGANWGLTWAPGAGLGRRTHVCQRGIVAGPGREGLPSGAGGGEGGRREELAGDGGVLLRGQRHPSSLSRRRRAALPSPRGGNGSACSAIPTCVCSRGWREGRGGGDTMQVTG